MQPVPLHGERAWEQVETDRDSATGWDMNWPGRGTDLEWIETGWGQYMACLTSVEKLAYNLFTM